MSRYYDRQGNPTTMEAWAQSFTPAALDSERVVARSAVGGARVSTVWLGLDHSFGDGPPLIFETMVFGDDDSEPCFRYSTEKEALAGHAEVVRQLEAGAPVKDVVL